MTVELPASESHFVVGSPVEDDGRLEFWNSVRSLETTQTAELTQEKEKQDVKEVQLGSEMDILLKWIMVQLDAQDQKIEERDQKIEEQGRKIEERDRKIEEERRTIQELQNNSKELKNEIRKINNALEDWDKEMDRKIDRAVEDKVKKVLEDQKEDWENLKEDWEHQNEEWKKELDDLKAQMDDRKVQMEKLNDRLRRVEGEVRKEGEEMRRVEGEMRRVEGEMRRVGRELAIETKERKADIERITAMAMPIHLHILLDESRQKIAGLLNKPVDEVINSQPDLIFDALEATKPTRQDGHHPDLSQQFSEVQLEHRLSQSTVEFLLTKYNFGIHTTGNNVSKDDIYTAVEESVELLETPEPSHLKELYEFLFDCSDIVISAGF